MHASDWQYKTPVSSFTPKKETTSPLAEVTQEDTATAHTEAP